MKEVDYETYQIDFYCELQKEGTLSFITSLSEAKREKCCRISFKRTKIRIYSTYSSLILQKDIGLDIMNQKGWERDE